jgi:hypothetical protein
VAGRNDATQTNFLVVQYLESLRQPVASEFRGMTINLTSRYVHPSGSLVLDAMERNGWAQSWAECPKRNRRTGRGLRGERGWIRTIDPCLKRALLCQLSYAPTLFVQPLNNILPLRPAHKWVHDLPGRPTESSLRLCSASNCCDRLGRFSFTPRSSRFVAIHQPSTWQVQRQESTTEEFRLTQPLQRLQNLLRFYLRWRNGRSVTPGCCAVKRERPRQYPSTRTPSRNSSPRTARRQIVRHSERKWHRRGKVPAQSGVIDYMGLIKQ